MNHSCLFPKFPYGSDIACGTKRAEGLPESWAARRIARGRYELEHDNRAQLSKNRKLSQRSTNGCSEDILIHDHDHHGINVQPKLAEKQPMTRYRDPNIMNPTCRPEKSKRTQPRKSKLLRQVLASLACLLGQEVWGRRMLERHILARLVGEATYSGGCWGGHRPGRW